jgi:hypothetical protein
MRQSRLSTAECRIKQVIIVESLEGVHELAEKKSGP